MDDYRLSAKAINCLKQHHRTAKTKREADRLKTVYLLGKVWTTEAVAEAFLKDERTISSYFRGYQEGSLA